MHYLRQVLNLKDGENMTHMAQMHSELWTETENQSHYEILGSMIRSELKQEKIRRLDLSYLGKNINQWWEERNHNDSTALMYSNLKLLILETLKAEDIEVIRSVGSKHSHIAAIFLEHVFHIADRELAFLVHEVMSEIAGIVDIKYPYEDHKELYPKNNDKLASDWGRGLGIIRPHSDDLYEDRAINVMCLTVCKDTSKTPTWFWLLQDVVSCLTDEELGRLVLSEANFLSGKNVEGKTITVVKPVLKRDPEEGIGMRLDFRIDDQVGARMRFSDPLVQNIFDKMRLGLKNVKPVCSNPSTGCISILSNYKVLHGRSALNPVMLYEGEKSRILFRSKGMK